MSGSIYRQMCFRFAMIVAAGKGNAIGWWHCGHPELGGKSPKEACDEGLLETVSALWEKWQFTFDQLKSDEECPVCGVLLSDENHQPEICEGAVSEMRRMIE